VPFGHPLVIEICAEIQVFTHLQTGKLTREAIIRLFCIQLCEVA